MNKIIYTLGFLLIFSLFNSAKAQTADVDPCLKINGAVDITTQKNRGDPPGGDQTCDTSGATNLTINIYSLGFCTSAPTINFVTGGKAADERDNVTGFSDGDSNFSSCTWTIKQSTSSAESLDSVGDIEPLPNDEIPPPGTYTHAVIVISNSMSVTGSATFTENIQDTTTTTFARKDLGNSGTKCWTNGSFSVDTGKQGLLIGQTSVANASAKKTAGSYQGGATCGDTPSPTANTQVSYYSNYETSNELDPCFEGGCNTTRSEENTAFGTLTVFFTTADIPSLATNSPIIQRSKIVPGRDPISGKDNGTATATNTLTGVFAYNTPMVVTSNTTGMEILINMSNALSLDFEPIGLSTDIGGGITNNSATTTPRIRSINPGPFGIQFRSVEGGGVN
jgi:hypothetical protein